MPWWADLRLSRSLTSPEHILTAEKAVENWDITLSTSVCHQTGSCRWYKRFISAGLIASEYRSLRHWHESGRCACALSRSFGISCQPSLQGGAMPSKERCRLLPIHIPSKKNSALKVTQPQSTDLRNGARSGHECGSQRGHNVTVHDGYREAYYDTKKSRSLS